MGKPVKARLPPDPEVVPELAATDPPDEGVPPEGVPVPELVVAAPGGSVVVVPPPFVVVKMVPPGVVVVVGPGTVVDVVVGDVVVGDVVVDDVVVDVVGVVEGSPATALQVKPLASVVLAVKVTSVFQ